MPVDPQIQKILDLIRSMNRPALETLTPEEARAASLMGVGLVPEDVHRVEDRTLPGPAGEIPVRLYQPAGNAPFPLLVYFHGGGWVIGGIESLDAICRSLANASGCLVVSVEYRLAPEHKFPGSVDDAFAATAYIATHAEEFGGDARRLAVGGDSAGGNLAAVVSQMARDRGGPSIAFQLLAYPVTDFNFDRASYRDNGEGYVLTASMMRWYWSHYLNAESEGAQAYASPLRAVDLRGLPPALVITAEYDPLRDEGEAYAAALLAAGVPTVLHRYDGMLHEHWMTPGHPAAREAIEESAAALRKALASPAVRARP